MKHRFFREGTTRAEALQKAARPYPRSAKRGEGGRESSSGRVRGRHLPFPQQQVHHPTPANVNLLVVAAVVQHVVILAPRVL